MAAQAAHRPGTARFGREVALTFNGMALPPLTAPIVQVCISRLLVGSRTDGGSEPKDRLANVAGHPDFDGWYRSIVEPGVGEGWSKKERQKREEFLRRWLLDFFNEHGPEASDVVESAFVQDHVRLAAENVSIVVPDVERTSGLRPAVVVDDYFRAVRISFNGNYTVPSLWAWENPEALTEVAGYLQEQMMDGGLWPLCPRHVQVLLPEVEGETATWWCRTGEHAVARIGDLGLS